MISLTHALAGLALAIGAPSWTAPMEPFRIAGDLYDVGSQGISAFLIKTKDGLILMDAGMPAYAPTLLGNIEKLGFRISDVKIIVASHAHFDHAGGLAAVKAATGAKLAVMDADVHWDETGAYPGRTDTTANFEPVKVDRVLKDGDTVTLGGETLTAHKTPGHTPGCTTWSFPVTEKGKTYTAMYQCSVSVAANVLVGPKTSYPGIVDDYRKSFATLKTLKADIFLAPHPEQFGFAEKVAKLKAGGPNPFIDPTELPKRVAAGEAAFEKDLAKQEAASKTASSPLPRSGGGVRSAATDGGGSESLGNSLLHHRLSPSARPTSPAARERGKTA